MSSLNRKQVPKARTHEGAPTIEVGAAEQLRRTVMCCMLWENSFYEDGVSIADRIEFLIPRVQPAIVARIAVEARTQSNLRHVPLLIARVMARHAGYKDLVGALLPSIILRPDELTEFLAIYWKDKKQPLSAQVKKGLAAAFKRFDEFALAKYNRDGAVKLRDVLFLTHPSPSDRAQQRVWDKLVKGTLATPDTWEVALSAKGNSAEVWTRLLTEKKLGGFALIRNLRNMIEQGVNRNLIRAALENMKTERILPFRFISAARYAPNYEPELEAAMMKCLASKEKLKGHTILLVDISGSMDDKLSEKSEMQRNDAAYGLAILAREVCESVSIYSYSNNVVQIPLRRGFALRDAINGSQNHGGTYTGQAVSQINMREEYDRFIIITDEQSADRVPSPRGKGYIINVGEYQHGIGYGAWTHINGWSDAVLDFITRLEQPVEVEVKEPVRVYKGPGAEPKYIAAEKKKATPKKKMVLKKAVKKVAKKKVAKR